MAFLKSQGQLNADDYPIAKIFDESNILAELLDRQMATMGVVVQAATLTTGMGASDEASKAFGDLIKRLNGE